MVLTTNFFWRQPRRTYDDSNDRYMRHCRPAAFGRSEKFTTVCSPVHDWQQRYERRSSEREAN